LGYLLRFVSAVRAPQGKALDKTLPQRYVRLTNKPPVGGPGSFGAGSGVSPNPAKDVPTIAAEFRLESASGDRLRRLRGKSGGEYPAAGVKEYWIIDPFFSES